MFHSHILEGNLLHLLKREATGMLGSFEDNKFGEYKSYNPLAVQQATALVTPRVAQFWWVPQANVPQLPKVYNA